MIALYKHDHRGVEVELLIEVRGNLRSLGDSWFTDREWLTIKRSLEEEGVHVEARSASEYAVTT